MTVPVKDTYTWSVDCQDGTKVQEFDASNTIGRGFAEVEGRHVKKVLLSRFEGDNPYEQVAHRVLVPEGATPVFFRRRRIEMNLIGDELYQYPCVHCIGWTRDEESVYLFVFEDGSTVLTNDLQAV